jgi:hypothetical protein
MQYDYQIKLLVSDNNNEFNHNICLFRYLDAYVGPWKRVPKGTRFA